MEENATAHAMQSSGVKPRPVIENAPELVQLRLILVDPDAQANVRLGPFSPVVLHGLERQLIPQ